MTALTATTIAPPALLLRLLETRALFELTLTHASWPWLMSAPRGDGHSVIVLPGFMADDMSTIVLRHYLARCGYDVQGWGLGNNLGPRVGVEDGMLALLDAVAERSGRPVSLVGWSLGGVYARVLAAQRPQSVRCVITMGSPITGDPYATSVSHLYEMTSGTRADDKRLRALAERAPAMPSTSIYSRSDGVVAWQCSLGCEGHERENVEVFASHLGLGVNPAVLYTVADRLAQAEGSWSPFDPKGLPFLLYPQYKRRHGWATDPGGQSRHLELRSS